MPLDDLGVVADALFAAEFVESAIALAMHSGDSAMMERPGGWRDMERSDAAIVERIIAGRGVLIPSVIIPEAGVDTAEFSRVSGLCLAELTPFVRG